MATLSTHATLDALMTIIADLETRVTDLRQVANALAVASSLERPYRDVGPFSSRPRAAPEPTDGPIADCQD